MKNPKNPFHAGGLRSRERGFCVISGAVSSTGRLGPLGRIDWMGTVYLAGGLITGSFFPAPAIWQVSALTSIQSGWSVHIPEIGKTHAAGLAR